MSDMDAVEVVEAMDAVESFDDVGEESVSEVSELESFDDDEMDMLDAGDAVEEEASEDPIEDAEESKEVEEPKNDESDESSPENDEAKPERTLDSVTKELEDGSLEVKIGEESLQLKDLKNDFIGQKEISKRFTEIDVKSKQLDADTSEINEYIDTFAAKLKDGDSVGAMSYFGEFAGIPPYLVKEQLIAALGPEILRRQGLSEMEVHNEQLQSQNEHLQEEHKSGLKRQSEEQATMELQSQVNDLREANGIDEQSYQDAMKHMEQNLPEGTELTPELVVEAIQYSNMYNQAESLVTSHADKPENVEALTEELVSVKERYPDFTEEDLKQVLNDYLDQAKKSSIEGRIKEKVEAKKAPLKQTKSTEQSQEDEIDPELEDLFD